MNRSVAFGAQLALTALLATANASAAPDNSASEKNSANQPQIKVVSLAPSNTELLFSVKAEKNIAAVTTYCDYPPAAKNLPKAGSFVSTNFERLARIKPDVVLLVDGREAEAELLSKKGFKTVVLHNRNLNDIADNLSTVGSLTGHKSDGDRESAAFKKALTDLHEVLKNSSVQTVFCCIWPNPLLTVGKASYLTDAITTCGGTSIAAQLPAAYPHFSMEKLLLANPDVIILPFESQGKTFLKSAPWSNLKAVKNNRVFYLPDAQHDGLSRPTLRIKTGLYWLAERVHPELKKQLTNWYDLAKAD